MTTPVTSAPTELDDRQALRIRRFLIAAATYGFAIAAAGLGAWVDLWSTQVFLVYTALAVGVNVAFYAVFVSGLNQRMHDPSLTAPQILAAVVLLLFMAYHAGAARGIVLLWVFLIFLFGVFRLKTPQLSVLAGITWSGYGLVLYLVYRNQPPPFNVGLETFQWLAVGGALAWFTFMGGYVSAMRSRLRRGEIYYRTIWETAKDGVLILDSMGRIEYANPAASAMLGCTTESLAGRDLLPFVEAQLRGKPVKNFGEFLESRETQASEQNRLDMLLKHADGRAIPAEVSIAEMRLEDATRHLAILRDITARKQSEQALIAAGMAAEAANRAKSQFLANMSHELLTPLNGIIGMTELLMNSSRGMEESNWLQDISRSGNTLLHMIRDVLDHSHIEAGDIAVAPEPFDLRQLASRSATPFERRARDKKIELVIDVAPDVPRRVTGDALLLDKVLSRLLDNAVRFTEQGRITLLVGKEQDAIRFEVSDTGPGIAPELQEKVFEAFTQANNSFARPHDGAGIGLTIARGLVHLMGGVLQLASAPGHGSRFWFTLNLPSTTHQPSSEASGTIPRYLGKKLLLIEDNAFNARMASALLGLRGIAVTFVPDGAMALQAYAGQHFDLVLMDCLMPGMDGFETTRGIRAAEAAAGAARTPIAAYTGYSAAEYRSTCLAAGMDDFISKPLKATELDALLGRWLADPSDTKTP